MAKAAATWRLGLYIPKDLIKAQPGGGGGGLDDRTSDIRLSVVVLGAHPSDYTREHDRDPDRITNPNDRTLYKGLHLHDLFIAAYASERRADTGRAPREVWGWRYEFSPHRVDRDNAAKLAKAVRTIDKRLDTLNTKLGYAKTFTDFVQRMALALKVDAIVLQRTRNPGWSYADDRHAIVSVGDGLNALDNQITAWLTPEPASVSQSA